MSRLPPSIKLKKRSFIQAVSDELFAKSWWVITFILLNFCVFHPIYKHLDSGKTRLVCQLSDLQSEKESALNRHSHLKFQIESQTDPAWVEMVLKKELGMVSEGQTKVHFLTQ